MLWVFSGCLVLQPSERHAVRLTGYLGKWGLTVSVSVSGWLVGWLSFCLSVPASTHQLAPDKR